MKRREFISWMGIGSIASSLPVAIAACSQKKTESNLPASSLRADGFQPVGTVAELDKTGQILNKKLSKSPVLVIREPANANQLIAVNPTCTHAGCTVTWEAGEKAFVCPCHDSQFASDGQVRQGPAAKPLAKYAVKLEGNDILVKTA
jgi:cytochrome b6-f complex iron-sulfur subunit